MKKVANRKQAGIGLIELIIGLVIVGTILAAVVARQNKAENKRLANESVATVSSLLSTLRSMRAPSGSYTGLAASEVNGMNVVSQPLTWNATTTTINDAWGNPMAFVGNAAGAAPTFVVTIGGTVNPLDREVCNLLATALVGAADVMNIGASTAITTTNGLVGGGSVYKAAGGVPSAANLSTGCQATNPVIGLQLH